MESNHLLPKVLGRAMTRGKNVQKQGSGWVVSRPDHSDITGVARMKLSVNNPIGCTNDYDEEKQA